MGWGDEIMASGEAWAIHKQTGRQVRILDRHGAPRRHDAWRGLSFIDPAGPVSITNGGQVRPYIDWSRSTAERWALIPYRPKPGQISLAGLDDRYRRAGEGRILIEATIKAGAMPGKQWPHWAALVAAAPRLPWLQCEHGGPLLPGVKAIRTPDFHAAAAVLATCHAAILPEGGLHHAAAALGTPAVVIFGEAASPASTGYAEQTSLYRDTGNAGWRIPHPAAIAAMEDISAAEALKALEGHL